MTLTGALVLILLHRADGGPVHVAPSQITSMHAKAPTSATNKLLTPEARCVIWLTDGRVLAVLEPCDEVRRLLDEANAAAAQ